MLLPHSGEEGCEIFLVLASSCYRNQSLAPFVRQVRLQCRASSRGRAGLSLEPREELGVQVCRTSCNFSPIFISEPERAEKSIKEIPNVI